MKKRKLRLHKETIHLLDSNELGRMAGGTGTESNDTQCPSYDGCTVYCSVVCTKPQSICLSCTYCG